MKIAIIGSGISGLSAALLLDKKYDVTLIEAASWIGGHVHTIPVQTADEVLHIDTGYIVCNPLNYPNFMKLLQLLDVATQATEMSFSVSVAKTGLEYNGTSLNGLFAQRKNLVNIKYLRMLRDIMKFNRAAQQFATAGDAAVKLSEFIAPLQLSYECREYYLWPMIAAIWSLPAHNVVDMPAKFLCQFFANHGLLQVQNRPQWRTIQGGSYRYVTKLIQQLRKPPLLNTPVVKIMRVGAAVRVQLASTELEFDKVVIATHSDQALTMLESPTAQEREVLGQISYQPNSVILHTDVTRLPRNRRAWASWNFRVADVAEQNCTVTYNMNILQKLQTNTTYCVSLNQDAAINPATILGKYEYAHPVLDVAALQARQRFYEVSGVNNIYYCGAYWGAGFHEDGLNSGLRVVRQIDEELFCAAPFTLDW